MTTEASTQLRIYLENGQIGAGYRTAFVLTETKAKSQLYIPSLTFALAVPTERARHIAPVIAERVDRQLAAPRSPTARRRRQYEPHPDQLALALE